MLTGIRYKIAALLACVPLALAAACGGSQPLPDIEATIEAKVEEILAAVPTLDIEATVQARLVEEQANQPVYISGEFYPQNLFGKLGSDGAWEPKDIDICSPTRVTGGFVGWEYKNPGWIGIKTAFICNAYSHDLTAALPQQLLIQLDIDRLPGNSVDSCVLTPSYKTPQIIPGLDQYLSTRYIDSYSFKLLIQRYTRWATSSLLPGNNPLPNDWIAITHEEAPGTVSVADSGISRFFEYSIKGTCIIPTAAKSTPVYY